MTFIKKLSSTFIILVAVLGLTACSEKEAETTGSKVDEMVKDAGTKAKDIKESAGNTLESAGDKLSEMKTDAGNAVEDACEKAKKLMKTEDTDC